MIKHVSLLLLLFIASSVNAQEIKKENLSKQVQTHWDFNKIRIQSRGKYYVDEHGESTDEHGKWMYYTKDGEVEEVRNYYKGMLFGQVMLYYPNGQKKQEGYFKWGRQDSLYTEWFETGVVKVEGEYNMDQAVGNWSYYYSDGQLKSVEETKAEDNYLWEFYLPDSLHTQTITNGTGEFITYFMTGGVKEWYSYKDGLKHGAFEEFSHLGFNILKGEFDNGEKHGTWEYTYATGDKEKISNYNKGVLDGDYQYFYDNGQVNVEGEYKAGQKSGKWTWYTNLGTRDMEGMFSEDQQHGSWTYWFPSGELSYLAKYEMGMKAGQWSYFYKNGKKFKEGTFENDVKNGMWRTWYEDETLLMEGMYTDGKEDGEWNNYWDSGDLKNKATFKLGLLDGEWLSFSPNGKPKLIGKYKNDLKVGEWQEFFENGRLKDVMTYKIFKKKSKLESLVNGHVTMESILHGHAISYSALDYKMTEEGDYKNGVKQGEWIAYHPGGKTPAVVSNYSAGELDGRMKQFSRRGKIITEIDYKNGVKHGKFIVYDDRGRVVKELNYEFGFQVIEGQSGGAGSFTPGK